MAKTTPAKPHLFPRERIEDGVLRGADNRPVKRDTVVRNLARYSESLQAEVPESVGRVVDIYRRNGQELVDVLMDGKSCAAGLATFLASNVKRSQARITSPVEAMPSKKELMK